ncbi:MAG: hypothetical protein ACK5U8_29160 [Deltaproteobacteria bacterium]
MKANRLLALACTLTMAGCGGTAEDDAGPPDATLDAALDAPVVRLYGQMSWKMRCPDPATAPSDCSMGCSEGVDRFIDSFEGEMGADITCTVTEMAGQRVLDFELQHVTGYAVGFQDITVPRTGGSALSGTVRFVEDNEYTGLAGGLPPSPSQPCQVTAVEFFRDSTSGDPTIRGNVFCQAMRAEANGMLCRGLTAPGGSGSASLPAQFTIFGCRGLTLP